MKPLRIWHQSTTEIESLGAYKQALIEHAQRVLGDDAVVEVNGLAPRSYGGRNPSDALGNSFVHHMILEPFLRNAVKAENDGFDAFVVGSFSEPFLRELRSAVDIPVVSITEASFLIGCSLGRYSVAIANGPQTAWMTRMSAEAHGLGNRVMRVDSIVPALEEPDLADAFRNPQPVIDSFMANARRAVADGADVIIPAEGILAEVLYFNNITRIDNACVIDVFGSAWAYALMLARLREMSGTLVGRAWHHRRDDRGFVQELAART